MSNIKIIRTVKTTADGKEEIQRKVNVRAPEAEKNEIARLWSELNRIEEKNKCLRVQLLDWLSDKLLDWSNRAHVMASNIDSPCVIKVEPRTKEESKSAKEAKEIIRLKEALAIKEQANKKLYKEKRQVEAELVTRLKKELAE
jgi:hypothetical protein